MSTRVNISQAKAELSQLIARALEGEEIIITRTGKPVVRLEPVRTSRVPGTARGKVTIAADFDAPLPGDILTSFEQSE